LDAWEEWGSVSVTITVERKMSEKVDMRNVAIELMKNLHEDEIAHLKLRMIRDNQAPRFEALKESHPEIYEEFMEARSGPHEILLKNRKILSEVLVNIIEGNVGELQDFIP
jgi:hypothetical protein